MKITIYSAMETSGWYRFSSMLSSVTLICLIFILRMAVSANAALAPQTPGTMQPNFTRQCTDLQLGQYICDDPEIDEKTQCEIGCDKKSRHVKVKCYPIPGLLCEGADNFYKSKPCRYTNGHEFSVALLLSVFLGMFGIDRFYLGYPALGLLKLCTLGFMLLGQLIDVMLIALQVVGPADGSDYVIDYYGPRLNLISRDNYTYVKPQYDYEVEL